MLRPSQKTALIGPFLSFLVCCLILLSSFFTPRCNTPGDVVKTPGADTFPYNLNAPSHTIFLVNEELREISGLSPTDVPGVFLAIADERGEIFFVDGNGGGAISRRVLFRDKGDFEGVEWVSGNLYAVKSNGDVFEIENWKDGKPIVTEYDTPLHKENDVEALGYDRLRHALLLACKQDPGDDTLRCIFAFDLKTKKLSEKPVYVIDPLEVNRMIPNSLEDKPNYFSPSGVAVHPKTGDVYVLSSSKKRLVALDYHTGAIKYVARLDKKLLPQPEGISFDLAGNLYLSSEGKKGEGLLLRFDYRLATTK